MLPLPRGSAAGLKTARPGASQGAVRALLKVQTLPWAPRGRTELLLPFPSLNVSLSLGPCKLHSDERAGSQGAGCGTAHQQSPVVPSGRASRSSSPAGGHWAGGTTVPPPPPPTPALATGATSSHYLLGPSHPVTRAEGRIHGLSQLKLHV